ncbi:S8 family serine peptidase [Deinococcus deserti]|uniref:Putative serine protease, subtilase family n=1 Tax=Deinococcus deserti (strain DSM 17065 / CIP 109153 / LMG 22923 / VCD115) TaxID=546414 RepID=C1D454_DEIDV|nr:S8 family serine peptidase [Deinococcus deserti]ACO47935.1 putative serine protease, subtilase family [Deinococcus deserti VCD115]
MDPQSLTLEQPAHIIVFRDVTPENADVLASILEAVPLPGADAGAQSINRTILSAANGTHARIYLQLGVAVATLTPHQIWQLRVLGNIITVAPNEERSIPERQVFEGTDLPAEGTFHQIGLNPHTSELTGNGVRVAVLDTGVDLQHPDLNILPGNTISYVPGEPDVQDQNGHGTHCAGIIAGSATPAGGIRYGVAPEATLLIAKVLNRKGTGTDAEIVDAINWAANLGAEIISMSLGSPRTPGSSFSARYETIASRLLDRGILLVAAAGNDSARPHYVRPVRNPAACPSIMGVAAVDHHDRIAAFSNPTMDAIGVVDIAAPGVGVLSAWPGATVQRSSGTSMATPHVAGVAALYVEQNPANTGRTLWKLLTERARTVAALSADDVGTGIVQAP